MMVMMDAVRFALHGAVNILDINRVVNSRVTTGKAGAPHSPAAGTLPGDAPAGYRPLDVT